MNKKNAENTIHEYYVGRDALSPVPIRVNSPVIKPENSGKMNAIAVQTMEYQAQQQLEILRRQANVILDEIRSIENRIQISHLIYSAELKFKPLIGMTYYLYEKDGKYAVSMISEIEWGNNMPFDKFTNSITLLADLTWQINP
jgi:predicted transcriptional regulator